MTDIRPFSLSLAAALLAGLALGLTACRTIDRGSSRVDAMGTSQNPAGKAIVPHEATAPNAAARASDDAELEHATCRPGADYRVVALDAPEPSTCKDICAAQMRCMFFMYCVPTKDRATAQCHLKHSIPQQVTAQSECVSWVNPRAKRRLAQLHAQGFELDTKRPGANFRDFEMDDDDPAGCKAACENLRDCKAFTYVRPGHDSDSDKAHCYLKDRVTEPLAVQDYCCISGVK